MCGACEFRASAAGDWTLAGADNPTDRAALRDRMQQILSRVLEPAGIAVFCTNAEIRLAGGPAAAEMRLRDPSTVWAAAERLTGRTLDPLDPSILAGGAA